MLSCAADSKLNPQPDIHSSEPGRYAVACIVDMPLAYLLKEEPHRGCAPVTRPTGTALSFR